ncbi:MAG: hypothetical protein AAB336_02530 [Acidobacteriota bacterium]
MSKEEFIQVIVKTFGVILSGLGVWYLLNLIGNIIAFSTVPTSSTSLFPVYADLIIRIILLLGTGSYLIKDGSLLFDLLDE